MGEAWVLGIDCGTQSLRAALYRSDGALEAQASRAYATHCPHVNWAEQNPEDWWTALCESVRACVESARIPIDAVRALACDGTSFTGVYCTEEGCPLRPAILWMDLRAAEQARRIEGTQHPDLDTCGRRVSAEWLLPKALWVREFEPEVYGGARRIVEGVDWLIHRLSGQWTTSNSNAAGKRHWTPERGWPIGLYEAAGLEDLAERSPDAVAYLGEPVGHLTRKAAEALGLNERCIVAHAGMDGWTSPIGKNCFEPGTASLTLGTSTVVIVETQSPAIINGVMGPFPDGIRRGHFTYEAGQASGASIVGWLVSLLGAAGDEGAFDRLAEQAARIPAGAEGLLVFDAWRGNRTPYFDPLARGTICGLTLEHGPAHLYRAVLEGCAYGIRNVVETLRRGGVEIREFRACGSGTANRTWMDIIATATGIPMRISAEKHATCLGSAMCAAVACGAQANLPDAAGAMAPQFETVEPGGNRDAYDAGFALYLDTYRGLRGVMHALAGQSGS